jgi:hypothetical protein
MRDERERERERERGGERERADLWQSLVIIDCGAVFHLKVSFMRPKWSPNNDRKVTWTG